MILFKTLLPFARPYWKLLALCSALLVVQTLAMLAIPWFGGLFAGYMLADETVDIAPIALALIVLVAAQAALQFISNALTTIAGEKIAADMKVKVHDHLMSLPIDFFDRNRHGELTSLFSYDVEYVRDFLTGPLILGLPHLIGVAGAVLMMAHLDPFLAAVVILLLPLAYIMLRLFGRELRPLSTALQKAYARSLAVADENLRDVVATKLFTREAVASRSHAERVEETKRLSIRSDMIEAGLGTGVQFLAAAAMVLLVWLLNIRNDSDAITTSQIVSFLLYAVLLTRPLSSMAGFWAELQHTRGALVRLGHVLDEPAEAKGPDRRLAHVSGAISIRDVSFAYPSGPAVLRNLSLSIAAGETVAITGRNGSGKTSLIQLLVRMRQPDRGSIQLDEADIATLDLEHLRQQIAFVPQTIHLLHASVADNIAFGRPGATTEEVERAAALAQAAGFIAGLPQGYDTIVGDDGLRLSGGQRQRIALARALLKDAPVLILDEPTAMFDPQGEAQFVASLRTLVAPRTVLLITHRPASLALADRIVTVSDGRIVADERPRSAASATSKDVA